MALRGAVGWIDEWHANIGIGRGDELVAVQTGREHLGRHCEAEGDVLVLFDFYKCIFTLCSTKRPFAPPRLEHPPRSPALCPMHLPVP